VIQSGVQIEPPGMHMIYLPYSDDIRHIEERYSDTSGAVTKASDDQIKRAADLIKRVDLKDFSVFQFTNPASLGGGVGNLQRIRAFLRIRLRDYGVLDFDAGDARRQPPVDTTWQQIYFCLRSGYYDEARNG
ncbi:ATP-dependent DNA helicase 2 subunit ku70-like protein, partial [Trifolium pratense]